MNRRNYLILLGVILALLTGALLLIVPGSPAHKKATLGLDLQGGLETVLKAVPPKGKTLDPSALDRSVSIMRNRIDKLGVTEPEIRKEGSDQIVIELAGVHDPTRAAAIIGKTAQLELYDFETSLTGPSVDALGNPKASATLFQLLDGAKTLATKGSPEAYYLFGPAPLRKTLAGPAETQAALLKPDGGKVPAGDIVLTVPQHTAVISCDPTTTGCAGAPLTVTGSVYYLFKHDLAAGVPQMTGSDLNLGGINAEIDTTGGQGNFVTLQFTSAGNKKFHDITRQEAVRGSLKNAVQHFAIVLDGQLESTPYIDYKQNPDGIDPTGGGAQISNIQTFGQAKDLALVLQTGALPVNFVQIERTDVSATLGKDSLTEAWHAAVLGLILVSVFLLVLYRFLGLIAVAGLAIYGAFLFAALLIFNVTLTLPGFAGMILTIGVAADANVVIFERIKEEVRAGKSVRAAIATGYQKGFRTIVDANVVTAITALILFAVATAGVKGFALMLLIGTVISLVTAVAATRAMLGLLAGFRWFENPSFMGASGAQRWKFLEIRYMSKRRIWFAVSAVVMLVSIVSLGVRGLNAGIDFTGGTQVVFNTPKPVAIDRVRGEAGKIGRADAVIQGRGRQVSGGYQSFQIRTKSLSATDQSTLQNNLVQDVKATSLGVKNVSASFGNQIKNAAILAVIVSLLLIVGYLSIRFDWKYAVPVIIALAHDLVITVGIYSLTGREVTASTVAAILTVLGYSIYDTIIVFDRIRENVPTMRRASFATIVDTSIWETIRRSLATTLITLLPIASLLAFGGATLKDFAFAILIGVASGAYSSIFIASPLLTWWKEREPDWARRRREGAGGGDELAEKTPSPKRAALRRGAAAGPQPALAGAGGADVPAPAAESRPPAKPAPASPGADARRERRRQRRSGRPHGRPR